MMQFEFDFTPSWQACDNHSGFYCMAFVPGGFFCSNCSTLLWQSYVPPDQPDRLGYVSATWSWRYVDGKPWTTQPIDEVF